tara:strand:- start:44 stop:412 length:369 start_codon:yes stop_codon:yes gene_type:complete
MEAPVAIKVPLMKSLLVILLISLRICYFRPQPVLALNGPFSKKKALKPMLVFRICCGRTDVYSYGFAVLPGNLPAERLAKRPCFDVGFRIALAPVWDLAWVRQFPDTKALAMRSPCRMGRTI